MLYAGNLLGVVICSTVEKYGTAQHECGRLGIVEYIVGYCFYARSPVEGQWEWRGERE